ncbi:cytochrome P450 26A1 isoform X1 [Octopus bimaculoides]|uniref:Cytochrome P450 26B1 n=2 Tax=Octopus bimaculoides TaxID=37653 RepID=A0A0L8FME9_OCTBM|nr:cytochrome P450 26A1 isoform X1 [Octopus bimaculoides]|eukprot:XP_014788587.1 PREDICTED: cytochrome P450 26A1-like isoform X1 [Octopus bimaculoides]
MLRRQFSLIHVRKATFYNQFSTMTSLFQSLVENTSSYIFYAASVILSLALISISHCFYFRLITKLYNLPPGTMGYFPLIGETLTFLKLKEKFTFQRHSKYGRVYKTHIFGSPTVRVCGSDNIRTLMMGDTKILQVFWPPSTQSLVGSYSLAVSSGNHHRQHKSLLLKTMTPSKLKSHLDHFQTTASEKIESWINSGIIDPVQQCRDMTVRSVIKYFIRNDLDESVIQKLIKEITTFEKNLMSIPLNIPGTGFYKSMKARAEICSIIRSVLCQNNKETKCQAQPKDFLNSLHCMLQENRDGNIERKIEDSILEIIFAGNLTTTVSSFSTLYLLANHPKVLQKLREELNEFGLMSHDGIHYPIVTQDHIPKLNYLQCVFKEILRRLPPVGGVYRKVVKPFQLEGYTIPANWRVVCSIRDQHIGDSTFDNPMTFNPDRWLETADDHSAFDFIPFGAASRRCVGKDFARLSILYTILELARRAQWKMQPSTVKIDFIPAPKPMEEMTAIFERYKHE